MTPDTLTYTIGAVVEEQPLPNSMGIALANNGYDKLFEKGRGLPLKATRDYRTTHAIRQGQSADILKAPVIEGELERADRNRLVGMLEIGGQHIRRDLPIGSEIEVTLRMDESRMITVVAYVPLLDEEFTAKVSMKEHHPNPTVLQREYEAEVERFQEVKRKAADAEGKELVSLTQTVEGSPLMKEVKELVASAKDDPDAAAKGEKRLLELKIKLDEAADALEWPTLLVEAREWLKDLNALVNRNGTPTQRDKATELADDAEDIITDGKLDRLRKHVDKTKRLYYEILFEQPAFWVSQFQHQEKQQAQMSDPVRSARLLDQGRECIANSNVAGLQNIVRQLWDLLPREVVEAAQRGYQSGLIR